MAGKDSDSLDRVQEGVWRATLPLEITLSPSESRLYDKSEPYLVRPPLQLTSSLIAEAAL